jgi:hypothetical protein
MKLSKNKRNISNVCCNLSKFQQLSGSNSVISPQCSPKNTLCICLLDEVALAVWDRMGEGSFCYF